MVGVELELVEAKSKWRVCQISSAVYESKLSHKIIYSQYSLCQGQKSFARRYYTQKTILNTICYDIINLLITNEVYQLEKNIKLKYW